MSPTIGFKNTIHMPIMGRVHWDASFLPTRHIYCRGHHVIVTALPHHTHTQMEFYIMAGRVGLSVIASPWGTAHNTDNTGKQQVCPVTEEVFVTSIGIYELGIGKPPVSHCLNDIKGIISQQRVVTLVTEWSSQTSTQELSSEDRSLHSLSPPWRSTGRRILTPQPPAWYTL